MKSKTTKLPVGTKSMAEMFELNESEMRNWKYLQSVKELFKDYNFEVLSKTNLISKLGEIKKLCMKEEGQGMYAIAIDRASACIQACYS